jgi:hypothetical protein
MTKATYPAVAIGIRWGSMGEAQSLKRSTESRGGAGGKDGMFWAERICNPGAAEAWIDFNNDREGHAIERRRKGRAHRPVSGAGFQ